jgi:hypothetical protein
MYLDLTGNPCCGHPDHEKRLLEALPNLTYLDNRRITNQKRLEFGLTPRDHLDDEDEMDDATTRETCELFSSTDMLTKCPRM